MWPFRGNGSAGPGHIITGRRGEKIARRTLRKSGLKILGCNYRCPPGEADIIALNPSEKQIVIAEVKTRSDDIYTSPLSAITPEKMDRLKKIARYYVETHNAEQYSVRFDIVSIVLSKTGSPQIEHIPDAF